MPDTISLEQRHDRFDLRALYDTSRLLSSSLDRDFVLDSLLFTAMSKLLVTRGMILLYDPVLNSHRVVAAKGVAGVSREDLISLKSTSGDDIDPALGKYRIAISLPITFGSRELGLVALGGKATGADFSISELDFIRSLINISAPAVHNSIMVDELKIANRDLDAKIQQLNTLFDLSQEFNATIERERLIRLLSLALMGQMLVRCHLFLLRPTDGDVSGDDVDSFEVVTAQGVSPGDVSAHLRNRLCKMDGLVLLDDETSDGEWSDLRKLGLVMAMPLRQQGSLCGVLCLGPKMTGQPYQPDDVEFLSALGNLALVSIRNSYLVESQIESRRLEEEVRLARRIQTRLLPQKVPTLPTADIAAAAKPSRMVGGDFYDVRKLQGDRILTAVADVTGKGIPASLLMANLQAALHVLFPMEMSLAEATSRINRVICENTDSDKFITYFHGIFESNTGNFTYVNAGHNPPYVIRSNGSVEELTVGGLLLGVMDGLPYEMGSVTLYPDDVVAMFTDGVTEPMNDDEEEFGEERLIECLTRERHGTAQEILDRVLADVEGFTGPRAVLDDDLTIVVLKARTAQG
jgi:phosphoserine phosphatase RsbU/P